VQEWSFNVQRELTADLGLQIGYVGSKGPTSIINTTTTYRYPRRYLCKPTARILRSATSPWTQPPSSCYETLQVSLQKRFSKGLTFLAGYTFSKSIDDGSAWNSTVLNVFDFHAERGQSTFDARRRFTGSYIYDLPFGRGRMFGSNWSGIPNQILGGWQTDGILMLQSGNPPDSRQSRQRLRQRPYVNGNPNDFNHDPAQWFNTAVFSRNFIGRFGDAGRDIVIGPGTADFDFSLLKNFPLWREDEYLQFCSEFVNLFNHPIFDNPTATNLTVVSATFSKITSASVQDPRFASRQIQFALRLVF
jgi:hypothetical protein